MCSKCSGIRQYQEENVRCMVQGESSLYIRNFFLTGKEPATSSPVVKSRLAFGSLVSICQLWQIWDKGNEMAKGNPIEVY